MVSFKGSTSRIRFSRLSESTAMRPESSGTPAPTKPVLPPCGTTGTSCA
jgi:hypothetical protein